MSPRIRAITARASLSLIEGSAGPLATDYEWPMDAGGVYEFIPGDTSTADGWAVLAPTGGGPGRWVRKRASIKGDALADAATETINIGGKPYRELASLSQSGTLTLGVVNAEAGDIIDIVSRNTAAYTYAIANGGATPSTLCTFASATPSWARAYFNGTDWELMARGEL